MCRNIKTLFNFEPPATKEEIRAASIQFVRKVGGSTKPSKANEPAFERAIIDISAAVTKLLNSLTTTAEPRDRDVEVMKARQRAKQRFGTTRSASRA